MKINKTEEIGVAQNLFRADRREAFGQSRHHRRQGGGNMDEIDIVGDLSDRQLAEAILVRTAVNERLLEGLWTIMHRLHPDLVDQTRLDLAGQAQTLLDADPERRELATAAMARVRSILLWIDTPKDS